MTAPRSIALAAAAVIALGALPGASAAAARAREAIEDDYPRALAAAKDRNVPILVDAWAPW
jgi:hypothetical protein